MLSLRVPKEQEKQIISDFNWMIRQASSARCKCVNLSHNLSLSLRATSALRGLNPWADLPIVKLTKCVNKHLRVGFSLYFFIVGLEPVMQQVIGQQLINNSRYISQRTKQTTNSILTSIDFGIVSLKSDIFNERSAHKCSAA